MKLCERIKEVEKRTKYTKSQLVKLMKEAKIAFMGDFTFSIIYMEYLIKMADEGENYKNHFHISYKKYFTKPIVYYVSKNINPEALKLINKRYYSFHYNMFTDFNEAI